MIPPDLDSTKTGCIIIIRFNIMVNHNCIVFIRIYKFRTLCYCHIDENLISLIYVILLSKINKIIII